MTAEPPLWPRIPTELAPYFETCFIYGFGMCDECGDQAAFSSIHPKFSDEWWLDEAAAMRDQGWIVAELQTAHCRQCALAAGLRHDPNAHTFNPKVLV